MATLFLIRHAEPAVKGVFLGRLDPSLSPAGHTQAQRALSNLQVEIAYVSPLRRAQETASYLRSAQVIVLPELEEIDFGEWTGKTWGQIQAGWPELASQKLEDWLGITPPNGESWRNFVCRVRSAWQRIRSGPSPAVVIAHEGVNAALASIMDGRSPLNFNQAYTEITSIEYTTD